ncbi:MAG: thiamine diphosphokinase [Hyphomicrobiaceae bacterium]
MRHYVVLLGGTLMPTARLLRQIAGARVIAADGGMRHAETLGLVPELWVGDFDSSSADLLARHPDVERQRLSTDKDKTDGEIAVEAAIARGAREIVMVGALGGQADHMLGHFALALRLAQDGLRIFLTSGDEEAHPLLPGTTRLDLDDRTRLSLIALAPIRGLSLEGTRWPLANRDVPLGSTLTLSNVAHGPVAIRIESGYGMALAYPPIR